MVHQCFGVLYNFDMEDRVIPDIINDVFYTKEDTLNPGCRKRQSAWEPTTRGSKVPAELSGHDNSA